MKINEVFLRKKNDLLKPYIIAEAGVNHGGKLDNAYKMIELAKESGANAIKFQTYKAEKLASRNSKAYWDTTKEKTKSQFDLFKKYDTFWKKEYELLKKKCDKCQIEFLSTPFDFESAKFLNSLMPAYKISSSDITNKPFIEYITRFNKPIILSTGASTKTDIFKAIKWSKKINIKSNIALLHCVLNYPTNPKFANLNRIKNLQKYFPNHIIGYSDHTTPVHIDSCKTAALFGAQIIEKHFTYNKNLRGNDHYHSADVKDLKKLIEDLKVIKLMLGSGEIDLKQNEQLSMLNARRSIFSNQKLFKGQVLNKNDIIFKRPGIGLPPSRYNLVLGKKLNKDIEEDNIITLRDLIK